jgi:predicted Holliday junction resolvase-like endonuclease
MHANRKVFQLIVIILLLLGLILILHDIINLMKKSSTASEELHFQKKGLSKKVKKKNEFNITKVKKLPGAIIIGEAKCGN